MDLLRKARDEKYVHVTNIVSVCCVLLYGLIRCLQFAVAGDYWKIFATGPITVVSAVLLVTIAAKTRDLPRLAFRMSAVMLAWFLVSAVLVGGVPHFFWVMAGLCGFCGMYFSDKSYLHFVAAANGAFLILAVVLRFPVMGEGVPLHDIMVSWLVSLIVLLFPTFVVWISSGRHRQSVKAQDFFNTVLSLTPDLVALLDGQNRVTYASHVLTRYSGVTHAELAVGRPVLDLFPDLSMKLMISEMLDTHGLHEVTREVSIGGETLFLKVITDEMTSGTKGRFLDICDVTSIMKAKVAAEQGARAKSEFLARMSHEIRTPMNAITGMTELILRENLSSAAAEHAMSIKQASANLLSIINDILDYSKIESGHMEILPVSYCLSSLINDVVSIIRMRVMEKPVLFVANIDCNIPNTLIGDEIRIRQVLLNILSNAVKFTSEGHILLAMIGEITGPGDVVLTIEVSDSGRGIKKEDMKKLFGDFVQLSSSGRQIAEGTGLGLSISRNLLRQMDGGISVASTFGVGSTFTITLPQKFVNEEKYAAVENPEEKSVLVYEPRSIYADSIVCTVDNLGVRCALALTQSEFYEKLEKYSYPFVFVSSFLLDKASDIISRLGVSTKLVLLAEFGDVSLSNSYTTMSMPAHAIPVANLLNGVKDELSYSAGMESNLTRFVAPAARVLVVDDINTNLRVAAGLMAPYQVKVDTCLSGIEAIELVKNNAYDVVFMDHMMPGMDGVEATEKIRALPGDVYQSLPIIALTANAVSGMREMFLQNGFSDYLPKPIETQKLHGVLEQWIPRTKQCQPVQREAEAAEPPLEIAGVNTKLGLSHTGGVMENYLQILGVFHRECTEKLPRLAECVANGDIQLFTIYVHAIRGSSASIGASRVAELADRLEHAGLERNIDFIKAHSPEFFSTLSALLSSISPVISINSPPEGKVDTDTLQRELLRLKAALEVFEPSEMDDAAAMLSSFSVDEEVRVMLERVLTNVLLGEYESAISCIKAMI